jgi:hypothetical protein
MEKSTTLYVGLDVHKESIESTLRRPNPAVQARFGMWAASEATWRRSTRRCVG